MLIALVASALALGAWTAWLVQRAQLPRWLYVPTAIATIAVPASALITAALLVRSFDDASTARASERQAALARGISDAMLPTAIGIAIAAAWLLVLLIATVRLQRRGRG